MARSPLEGSRLATIATKKLAAAITGVMVHTPILNRYTPRGRLLRFDWAGLHSRIWIEKEVRQPAGVKVRPARNRPKWRRFGRRFR
jgi:hypothetical protein